eukprot:4516646-Prorocentrum_lima.AAC.1
MALSRYPVVSGTVTGSKTRFSSLIPNRLRAKCRLHVAQLCALPSPDLSVKPVGLDEKLGRPRLNVCAEGTNLDVLLVPLDTEEAEENGRHQKRQTYEQQEADRVA